jgi:hypothetical protein
VSEAAPDPVATEDGMYVAVGSDYRGLRRAGLGIVEAAVNTAAYRVMAQLMTEAQQQGTGGEG